MICSPKGIDQIDKPELEELSGGAAIAKQAFVIFLVMPFALFMTDIILRVPFSMMSLVFLLVLAGMVVFSLQNVLSYADIYLSENFIVIKKITGEKRRPVADFKTIEEAFTASSYYIEFNDLKKVYFTLTIEDLGKRIIHSGTDVAKILIETFEERKQLYSSTK